MSITITTEQVPAPFTETCLPLTMELARALKTEVTPLLVGLPRGWTFEDKVLVMLVPSMDNDVAAYHAGGGSPMTSLLQPHQVAHLDSDLLVRLCARLEQVSPGIVEALKAAATR